MRPRPIHLVGVGGAGMSGLARLAADAGYRVSGTDREDGPALAALRSAGVAARAGHRAEALPGDVEAVVVSTAVPDDNPEVVEARRRGLPLLHRAAFLDELMSGRRGIAVAGAHGKSTTSAMLALALGDATACVGATTVAGSGTGGAWGAGPWFVAEADESDRSLLALHPEAALLLNVDHDHHATFASIDEVEDVFREFVGGLPPDGVLVVGPDARARRCAEVARCRVLTVGGDDPDLAVEAGDGAASLVDRDGRRFPLRLSLPGRHNQDNAACAAAMAAWCGVPLGTAAERLEAFTGVGRRFEDRGEAAGVRVVDDYAHHPAEVAATLAAARETGHARVIAVFQPHLYSRTREMAGQLGAALAAADAVVVTEIYAAREQPEPGVSGRLVADAVPAGVPVRFAATLAEAVDAALELARPGDLVLTLGAGDITLLGEELLARMGKGSPDGHGDHGGARDLSG